MEDKKKRKRQGIYMGPRSRLPSNFASTLMNTRSQRKEKCLQISDKIILSLEFNSQPNCHSNMN